MPLAKVLFGSVTVYAITATAEMLLPAHLPTTKVAWLVQPWLGAYIHTFPPASVPYAAMQIGLAGLAVLAIAIYLDHCVIDQPWWAVLGGWAPLSAGVTLVSLQSAFGAWWVSVDIDHSVFPLGYCEVVAGLATIGASWLVAPDLFNPRLGRRWVAATIVAVLTVDLALSRFSAPTTVDSLVVVLVFAAGLTAGERSESRRLRAAAGSSGAPAGS